MAEILYAAIGVKQHAYLGSIGPFLYDTDHVSEDSLIRERDMEGDGVYSFITVAAGAFYLSSEEFTTGSHDPSDDKAVVYLDAALGDITLTLPPAADNSQRKLTIIRVDSSANVVSIEGDGAETISGEASFDLLLQYESLVAHCDGLNWYAI